MNPVLSVKGLTTTFKSGKTRFAVVDDVSFDLYRGRTLCIVGESGCGKSMTALSIMRLVPAPAGQISKGEIWLDSTDVLGLSSRQMREIRGARIAMIFQEPMTSLNPVLTVRTQIREMFALHQPNMGIEAVDRRIEELLGWVGIPAPRQRMKEYPHQLSGGMRQRVMIAMALSCSPDVLIADEPTTALDVTIQAQILELFGRIQRELNMALILVTHDFGVVSEIAHDVAVMYAGRFIETGSVEQVFKSTAHPYTYGLLKSIPPLEHAKDQHRLYTIPGTVPNLSALPKGCRFSNRCPYQIDACVAEDPPLVADRNKTHPTACIRPGVWQS